MTHLRILAAGLALCGSVALGDEPSSAALLELHLSDAKAYRIFRDEKQTQALDFHPKSIFTWQNLGAEATQSGHLFVWTNAGRPEAIGTIFSNRTYRPGQRQILHEFHTLAEQKLFPVTPENCASQWTPEKGLVYFEVQDAPTVSSAASKRLPQMRGIARSFAANSKTRDGQTWELRLLPTPLFQYQPPPASGVLDGAIFAMVSSAGTDPEVLLVVEARRPGSEGLWTWHAAAVRFSDKDLVVRRNGALVWSSLDEESHRVSIRADYSLLQTPGKDYMCYLSRTIDELPAATREP